MTIVKFDTKQDAQEEADRLVSALGLPTGMTYGYPFETQDEKWALKVKENGTWPATGVIIGEVIEYIVEDE